MANRGGESGILDEVISIRFHTKVTKGGRKLSVAALVAVGDGNGRVGLGYAKASGVPQAIEKASKFARGDMFSVEMLGDTLAHEAVGRHGSARVLLKPASPGTGVKAGSTVRSILQVLGVHNVLSKVFGNTNPINVARATAQALQDMRSVAEVERLRGVKLEVAHPQTEAREHLHAEEFETEAEADTADEEADAVEEAQEAEPDEEEEQQPAGTVAEEEE